MEFNQWGSSVIQSGNLTSNTTVFPIAFSNSYKISATHQAIGGSDLIDAHIGSLTSVYFKKTQTGSDTFTIAWIAVGA